MKLVYEFVIQEVAGSYMAVAVGPGSEDFKGMIRLNKTGEHIFRCLMQGADEQSIVSSLQDRFDVTDEQARSATSSFLAKLRESGVLAD